MPVPAIFALIGRLPFFQIWYGSTYSLLFIFTCLLTAVSPVDQIAQLIRSHRLPDIFALGIIYLLTWLVCLVVYLHRVFTTRAALAGIPKTSVPVGHGDVGSSTRRMIVRQWRRAAVLAWEARPRRWMVEGCAEDAARELDRRDRVDRLVNGRKHRRLRRPWSSRGHHRRDTTMTIPFQPVVEAASRSDDPVPGSELVPDDDPAAGMFRPPSSPTRPSSGPGPRRTFRSHLHLHRSRSRSRSRNSRDARLPSPSPVRIPTWPAPWGQISHPGWSMDDPRMPDGVEYAAVIEELPALIEAHAVSLAPALTAILFDIPPEDRRDDRSGSELRFGQTDHSGLSPEGGMGPSLIVTAPSPSPSPSPSLSLLPRPRASSRVGLRHPITVEPDPRVISALRRQDWMSLEDYLNCLVDFGVAKADDVDTFLDRYSSPDQAPVTADEFADLIEACVQLMDGMSVDMAAPDALTECIVGGDVGSDHRTDRDEVGRDTASDEGYRFDVDDHDRDHDRDRDRDDRFFDQYLPAHLDGDSDLRSMVSTSPSSHTDESWHTTRQYRVRSSRYDDSSVDRVQDRSSEMTRDQSSSMLVRVPADTPMHLPRGGGGGGGGDDGLMMRSSGRGRGRGVDQDHDHDPDSGSIAGTESDPPSSAGTTRRYPPPPLPSRRAPTHRDQYRQNQPAHPSQPINRSIRLSINGNGASPSSPPSSAEASLASASDSSFGHGHGHGNGGHRHGHGNGGHRHRHRPMARRAIETPPSPSPHRPRSDVLSRSRRAR